jgi:hypothetical protein
LLRDNCGPRGFQWHHSGDESWEGAADFALSVVSARHVFFERNPPKAALNLLALGDEARLGPIHVRLRGASVQGNRAYVQNGVEPIRDEYLAAGNF